MIETTAVENLYLLPSGKLSAEAIGILNSQQMVDFVEEARSRFDILFFDSSPVLGMSDAAVLASVLDSVVVVVQHRRLPRTMLRRIQQAVVGAGGNIIGVVLNNVDLRHDEYYGYAANYRSYYGKRSKGDGKPVPQRIVADTDAGILLMKRILAQVAAILTAVGAMSQDVLLRPGDQIELRLGGVPSQEIEQISGQYQVDGQGFLNLPHIGKVRAAGLAQAELQNSIEAVYRSQQIYTHPTITINVPTQARFVNVGGDVKTPRACRVHAGPDSFGRHQRRRRLYPVLLTRRGCAFCGMETSPW